MMVIMVMPLCRIAFKMDIVACGLGSWVLVLCSSEHSKYVYPDMYINIYRS